MERQVNCKVEECLYNDGFRCVADAIEVRSSGNNIVNSSEGTACETFTPKNVR